MQILPNPITFEWDKGNTEKNLLKHKVTNQETEEIFINKPFLVSKDIKHSQKELRFQAMGKTNKDRLLFVSFTTRDDKVRVISSRDASKKERRSYEEKTKTNS